MAVAVRVSLLGEWFAGTWLGETAQIGVTLAMPGTSGINDPLDPFVATAAGGSGSWTSGTYTLGWDGELDLAAQEDAADAMVVYANAVDQWQSDEFHWNEVRVAALNTDGSYVNGASVFTIGTPVAGDSTSMAAPPQSALVTTLRTGGRGPRNRGRWYLPIHSTTVYDISAGIISGATLTTANAAANALLDGLNTLGASLMGPAVVSMVHQTRSDITATAIGDEMDSQNRRRHQRRESYQTLAWP